MAIYWFNGNHGSGKTTLASKLHKFLKTERRNWRRDVFHIDDLTMREIFGNNEYTTEGIQKNIEHAVGIVNYLYLNGCDVVVSVIVPNRDVMNEIQDKFGSSMQQIFVHNDSVSSEYFTLTDFESPEINFIDVDTSKKSPDISFSKIINNLIRLNKL